MVRTRDAFWCFTVGLMLACVVAPGIARSQAASQLPGVQHPDAWRALEDHRYADAAEMFEAALSSGPEDAALWFGAGVASLMRGLNTQAQPSFERALAIEPSLTDASILLGQALYREGDVERAIDTYERALLHAPEHPELVEPLARWRLEVAADATYRVIRGAHFDVLHLPSDEALGRRALEVLEAARGRLAQKLAASTRRRVEVVLYSPAQFRELTRLPAWAVGIYDGRIKAPLGGTSATVEDLERVLEHELVHAIVAAIAGPTVPAWLNEGLATALERDGAEWAAQVGVSGPSVPIAELARGFRNLMPPEARAAYATSTRVVQRLLDQHGAAAVVGLLQAIGRGHAFPRAFQDAFARTFEDFVEADGDGRHGPAGP